MAVFPLFQKIDGMTFLVVGDGEIARRKTQLIRQFTDRVLVIPDRDRGDEDVAGPGPDFPLSDSSDPGPSAASLPGAKSRFTPSDLEKTDFCVAATDDEARNHRIAALCMEKGIPVNVPDDPEWCTFYLPAVAKRGDLTIAISTDGKSPAFAAHLRREIENVLPLMTEEILDRMGELRDWVPQHLACGRTRRGLYREILQELLSGDLPPEKEAVEERALSLIREQKTLYM